MKFKKGDIVRLSRWYELTKPVIGVVLGYLYEPITELPEELCKIRVEWLPPSWQDENARAVGYLPHLIDLYDKAL